MEEEEQVPTISSNSGMEVHGVYLEPICDDEIKPFIGQRFRSEEDVIVFYKKYAEVCGFDVRLTSATKSHDKQVNIWRYMVCSREGKKFVTTDLSDSNSSENIKRRRLSNRCLCMARMVIRYIGDEGFEVKTWVNQHTHPLFGESYKQFLKVNRKVDSIHQKFFFNCHRASIGPMKSFKSLKEVVGGYEHVGCSSVDFKKFGRDMRAHITGVDAQMILDAMHEKCETCSGFNFDYQVDDEDHLKNIFWADSIARRNFHVFGDIVSFDATYNTNRYDMRFLPFTGKDNHGKIISFGASLLAREDVESYAWVLEKFIQCIGAHPYIILTDQDPALKIAVERVLVNTRHRLCMWHIKEKAPKKICKLLNEKEEFLKRFNSIVWNDHMLPEKFDEEWTKMLSDFQLAGDNWFQGLYNLKNYWVSGYFLDCPMGGLVKTTSISESVNSFFGRYTRHYSNLVEFFMHFDNAIESQRYTNMRLNSLDLSSSYELKTDVQIEKHASILYTNSIFKDVQDEIYEACYRCRIENVCREGDVKKYEVAHRNGDSFWVVYNELSKFYSCGCKKFERVGLLCCHIFLLLKDLGAEEIPEIYVKWRWTKQAYLHPVHSNSDSNFQDETFLIDERKVKIKSLHAKFYEILALVEGGSLENIDIAVNCFTDVADRLRTYEGNGNSILLKKGVFEQFYGKTIPNDVSVLPPKHIKAKGSGSRIKSKKEKVILETKKQGRTCKRCKQVATHDSRNCNVILDEQANI